VESFRPRILRPKEPYDERIAWADNRLSPTEALVGREISLEREDGETVTFGFDSVSAKWHDPGEESTLVARYDAVELREGVFSVDVLLPEDPGHPLTRVALSLALNLGSGGAVLVRNTITLGDAEDFHQEIRPCSIVGSGAPLPELSAELVGRRAYAEYTDGRAAEHVYLNSRRLCTQGLRRFESSGAKLDDSTVWKLGDELYLLTWVQEWHPVGAALLMDFAGLRNAGVFMGRDDEGFFHFFCGARLGLLGRTTYPQGRAPAAPEGSSASMTLQPKIYRPQPPYEHRFAWSRNRVPSTNALAGRQIPLERDDGQTVTLAFDAKTVSWRDGEAGSVDVPYDAVELREGVFSVELVHPAVDGSPSRHVATSLALNLRNGTGLLVRHTVTVGDESDLRQDVYPCRITGSGASYPELSAELVGRRAYVEYADGDAVEHVYLNPRRIGWQSLGGNDVSSAGCEESTTWKLGEELFVLAWVKDWKPVAVMLLMDFERHRNAGAILGQDDEGFFHFLCGARVSVLGQTAYPPGYEPGGVRKNPVDMSG